MLRVESTFILSDIFLQGMSLHNDGDGIISDALEEDFQTLSTDWVARLCN